MALRFRPHGRDDGDAEHVEVHGFAGLVRHLMHTRPGLQAPIALRAERHPEGDGRHGWSETHVIFANGEIAGYTDGPVVAD